MSVHLPVALLSLAFAVFVGVQISAVNRGSETVRWQLSNLEKRESNLKAAQKQFDDLSKQREELVKQAGQIGQQYNALLNDVLDLAREDSEVQAVVQKWGIQRKTPPAGEAAPAPPAEPAPGAGHADGPS